MSVSPTAPRHMTVSDLGQCEGLVDLVQVHRDDVALRRPIALIGGRPFEQFPDDDVGVRLRHPRLTWLDTWLIRGGGRGAARAGMSQSR